MVELGGVQRAEDRLEPLDGSEDREPDDRRHQRREQRLGLEVVAVEDLGAEHGAAERSPEDRPDAGPDADRHGDPGVLGAQLRDVGPAASRTRR